MKIGIIVAMESELRLVANSLEGACSQERGGGLVFYKGRYGSVDVVLCQAGVGKVNAAVAATAMILEETPDFIINSGVAGSLDERVKQSDVIVGSRVKYCDVWCGKPNSRGQVQGMPEWFPTMDVNTESSGLRRLAKKFNTKRRMFSFIRAPIVSGDWFMETVADKMKCIRASGHAKAVDMESGAIAQVCYRFGVPFLPVRVISDVVGIPNHQARYDEFWKKLADRSFEICMQFVKDICESFDSAATNGKD
jgi:adenosylhomocysteine nucleosidase